MGESSCRIECKSCIISMSSSAVTDAHESQENPLWLKPTEIVQYFALLTAVLWRRVTIYVLYYLSRSRSRRAQLLKCSRCCCFPPSRSRSQPTRTPSRPRIKPSRVHPARSGPRGSPPLRDARSGGAELGRAAPLAKGKRVGGGKRTRIFSPPRARARSEARLDEAGAAVGSPAARAVAQVPLSAAQRRSGEAKPQTHLSQAGQGGARAARRGEGRGARRVSRGERALGRAHDASKPK